MSKMFTKFSAVLLVLAVTAVSAQAAKISAYYSAPYADAKTVKSKLGKTKQTYIHANKCREEGIPTYSINRHIRKSCTNNQHVNLLSSRVRPTCHTSLFSYMGRKTLHCLPKYTITRFWPHFWAYHCHSQA